MATETGPANPVSQAQPPTLSALGGRFVFYVVILFASWYFNLLVLPSDGTFNRPGVRTGHLGFESSLVLSRLARQDLGPFHCLQYPGGGECADYTSQFGLAGVVLGAIKTQVEMDGVLFALLAGAATALLTATMAGAVFAGAQRWLGPPVGDLACFLAAFSGVLLPFATSLYWAPFLLLMPFTIVWCLYPLCRTPGRKAVLFTLVGLAVLTKSLCGYEYITTVVLAPLPAAWFHQHRLGEGLRRRFLTACVLVVVGLLGFGSAMALHIVQLRAITGGDGIEVIRGRARARIKGKLGAEGLQDRRPTDTNFTYARRCFLEYFDKRVLVTPEAFGRLRADVTLRWVTFGVGLFAVFCVLGRRKLPRGEVALAGAAVLGLATSASWQVMAINHMCVHRHLNLQIFSAPFLPLAFVVAGCLVRPIAERAGLAGKIGPAALAGVAALMLTNGVQAMNDAGRERQRTEMEQLAAENRVVQRLASAPTCAEPHTFGGHAECTPLNRFNHHHLLVETGLFDSCSYLGGASDPNRMGVYGWISGVWGGAKLPADWPLDRPTARLVLLSGGKPVPTEVVHVNLPDFERMFGQSHPGAGYVATFSRRAVQPGQPIRVFVVSAIDPNCITELPPIPPVGP
jgi:hypothetical protein